MGESAAQIKRYIRFMQLFMDFEQCAPSLSQANRMKRLSQSTGLDMDMIYSIMGEEKPNQREQIKIRAKQELDYAGVDGVAELLGWQINFLEKREFVKYCCYLVF